MSGEPGGLYAGDAAESESEALRRSCDRHGTGLRYRPAVPLPWERSGAPDGVSARETSTGQRWSRPVRVIGLR
ncbi:hypothetical protein [Streptomyces nitrosporeus]|uniref:hypothetical protein n=1 Tax=Streptomyces nitrosporeus TaxID=28894 RepID=UPI0039A10A41